VFGPGWLVRTQAPIALDDESEPEPDVAVAQGPTARVQPRAPCSADPVVEVAVSSLSFDRDYKGSLYARAQLQDYWIVNLADRVLEIYRQPVADAAAAFGWRYASTVVLDPEAAVTPLAAPGTVVAVADLLP
jgi:Uma2 family endonuclease